MGKIIDQISECRVHRFAGKICCVSTDSFQNMRVISAEHALFLIEGFDLANIFKKSRFTSEFVSSTYLHPTFSESL